MCALSIHKNSPDWEELCRASDKEFLKRIPPKGIWTQPEWLFQAMGTSGGGQDYSGPKTVIPPWAFGPLKGSWTGQIGMFGSRNGDKGPTSLGRIDWTFVNEVLFLKNNNENFKSISYKMYTKNWCEVFAIFQTDRIVLYSKGPTIESLMIIDKLFIINWIIYDQQRTIQQKLQYNIKKLKQVWNIPPFRSPAFPEERRSKRKSGADLGNGREIIRRLRQVQTLGKK